MVVPAGEQRGPGGRAQRRHVKTVVTQPLRRQLAERRRLARAAKRRGIAEAGVIHQHQQDVRRAPGRRHRFRKVRPGAVQSPVGHALKGRLDIRQSVRLHRSRDGRRPGRLLGHGAQAPQPARKQHQEDAGGQPHGRAHELAFRGNGKDMRYSHWGRCHTLYQVCALDTARYREKKAKGLAVKYCCEDTGSISAGLRERRWVPRVPSAEPVSGAARHGFSKRNPWHPKTRRWPRYRGVPQDPRVALVAGPPVLRTFGWQKPHWWASHQCHPTWSAHPTRA